jgi:hypothetical protein
MPKRNRKRNKNNKRNNQGNHQRDRRQRGRQGDNHQRNKRKKKDKKKNKQRERDRDRNGHENNRDWDFNNTRFQNHWKHESYESNCDLFEGIARDAKAAATDQIKTMKQMWGDPNDYDTPFQTQTRSMQGFNNFTW